MFAFFVIIISCNLRGQNFFHVSAHEHNFVYSVWLEKFMFCYNMRTTFQLNLFHNMYYYLRILVRHRQF